MRFWLAVSIWLTGAVAAPGGPWPREKGAGFVALTSDGVQHQLYAEYGIGNDWTLGLEVKQHKEDMLPAILSFVQHPVWRGNSAILSAGVGVEQRETLAARPWPHLAGLPELAIRGGLFWGRGFQGRWGSGWMTLETQVERVITEDWFGASQSLKVDASIGLKPSDRIMILLQAQGWKRQNSPMKLRIEPMAGIRLGRVQFVAAPSVEVLDHEPDPRLKLGVWFDF
ncbi:MAG: hypothetical protein ACK5M4_03030 [Pseudorhodobacter sp.]